MTKNRGILVSVLATFLLIGCSLIPVGPATVGSGRAVTEQREVGSFSKVRVGTAIQATVLVGPDASISVTADDNLLSSVSTDVTAGRLTVMIQGNSQPRTPVSVQITVPSLDSIEATSAASVTATGINSDSFEAAADSAASLVARGNASTVSVSANSAGMADLGDLPAQSASVNVESAAHATVNAQVGVSGRVETGGVVTIEGQPQSVNVTTNTGGVVVRD